MCAKAKRKFVRITYQSFPFEPGFKATARKFHKLNLCRERRISDVLTRDLNLNGRAFKVNRFDAKNLSTHPPKS